MADKHTVEKLFGPEALSEPAKPGSRRARREAERRATAEIPVVTDTPSIDSALAADAQPAISAETYETLDAAHDPAKSECRFRFFKTAGVAAVALAALGSSLGLAAASDRAERATAAELVQESAGQGFIASKAASENQIKVEHIGFDGERGEETMSFTAVVNGEKIVVPATETDTYASALNASGIRLGADDEVSVPLNDPVKAGATVTIKGVKVVSESDKYTEKFKTKKVDDASLEKGTTKVKTKGKNGTGVRTYDVRYVDGKEVSRTLTMETVSQAAVDEVILVGTAEPKPVVAQAPTTSSSTSGSSSSNSTKSTTQAPAPAAPAPGPAVSSGSARGIAQGMLASYGWGMDQWPYLDKLWQRESGWNYRASNPSSGAYGIPQALPGGKMASAGADWQTNPATQIRWGLGYIKGRYGSPAAAWAHSQSVGWY